jgi:hypothetical protein
MDLNLKANETSIIKFNKLTNDSLTIENDSIITDG